MIPVAECEAALTTCATEALAHGVVDLPAAVAALEAHEGGTLDDTLSVSAAYVEQLLLLDAQSALASNKAAMALVLRGPLGVQAHAKGNDVAYREKVEKKCAALAAKLGIAEGARWEASSPQYLAGLAELRCSMAAVYEHTIEELVFKRKCILKQKMVESGKNANSLAKALQRNRTEIDGLLEVRGSFLVLGTENEPPAVNLDVICRGEVQFPWVDAALGAATGPGPAAPSDAAKRHFGRRYRMFKAQKDRTVEEEALLGMERVLTLNWLEERLAAARAAVFTAETGRLWAAECNKRLEERSFAGKAALALRTVKQLEPALEDAQRRLGVGV